MTDYGWTYPPGVTGYEPEIAGCPICPICGEDSDDETCPLCEGTGYADPAEMRYVEADMREQAVLDEAGL